LRELAAQVDAAYAQMRELSCDEVGNAFRAQFAERLESQERTNRALSYRMFRQIADPPDEAAMAPRRQVSGAPLPPELPRVAAALAAGAIGEDHLRVISHAIDVLPSAVSVSDRDEAEATLVRQATKSDADIVKAVAAPYR
jgi:hypothetical protein